MIDSSTYLFARLITFGIILLALGGVSKLCSSNNNVKDYKLRKQDQIIRNTEFNNNFSNKDDVTAIYRRKMEDQKTIILPESELTKNNFLRRKR